MLSDEMAKMSLDITKEGIVVVGKTIEAIFGFTSIMGKGMASLGQSANDKINNSIKGEVELDSLMKSGQPLTQKDVTVIMQDEKWRKEFDKLAIRHHMPYSIVQTPDASVEGGIKYEVCFRQNDVFKMNMIVGKVECEIVSYNSAKEVFGKEVADNIDFSKVEILSEEEKQRIMDNVKDQSNEINKNNPIWDNEPVWETAWKDTYFEGKTDIFKEDFKIEGMDYEAQKKDVFLFHVTSNISKTFGKDHMDENFLHVWGKGIVYLDGENKLHYINLGEKTHISRKLEDPKDIKELKETLSKTNARMKNIQLQLDYKYKDFTPDQQAFLNEALIDAIKNPNIDVSQFDNIQYPVEKMAMIKYCQEELQDISKVNKIIAHDFSADQIVVLKDAMLSGIEHDILFNPKFATEQIKEMVEEIKHNPDISNEKLEEIANETNDYKKTIENELFGGEVKKEHKPKEISLNERIIDVRADKSIGEAERKSSEICESLENNDKFSRWWYVAPVTHTEDNQEWKEIASYPSSKWYVNSDKEVKMLKSDKSYQPDSEEFKHMWNDEKAKNLYVDRNGIAWKSIKESKKGRLLMNDKGKTFIQRKENFKYNDLKQMKENHIEREMQKGKNISTPSKNR